MLSEQQKKTKKVDTLSENNQEVWNQRENATLARYKINF